MRYARKNGFTHPLLGTQLTLAFSINQGDIPERGQQVTQMRAIYEKAKTVIVWLGPDNEAHQASVAIEAMEKIASFLYQKLDIKYEDLEERNIWFELTTTSRHLVPTPDKCPVSSPEVWDALTWVFKHQYFTRVWAIQEVNANRSRVAHIGKHSIPWTVVNLVAGYIDYEPAFKRTHGFSDANTYLAATVTTELPNLDRWHCFLYIVSQFVSTDPRDVIYGLFGMMKLSDEASKVLKPDYNKDVIEVYRDSVEAGLLTYENTDVMLYVTGKEEPSWIPRWDVMMPFRSPFRFGKHLPWKPSLKSKPIYAIDKSKNIISLQGLVLDTIESVEFYKESCFGNFMLDHQEGLEELRTVWRRILETIEKQHTKTAPFDYKTMKAIAVTFSYGLDENSDPGNEEVLLNNFLAYLYLFMSPADAERFISPDLDERAQNGDGRLFGKPVWGMDYKDSSFYITKKGFFGATIGIAKHNDIVFIPSGTTFPFVMKRDQYGDECRMVAFSWVYGIMHGQEWRGQNETVRIR